VDQYLILVGNGLLHQKVTDRLCRRFAGESPFSVSHKIGDVTVVSTPTTTLTLLAANSGIIIGSVFGLQSRLGQHDSDSFLSGIRNGAIWGDYIAVVISRNGGFTYLATSPFGENRVLEAKSDCIVAYASSLDLLAKTDLVDLTIDWNGISSFLKAPELRSDQTCINGVRRVLPGSIVDFGSSEKLPHLWWKPWDFIQQPRTPKEEWPEQLFDIINACARDWGSRYKNPLFEISGGLDSSIIAASIGTGGGYSVTIVPKDMEGDERPYARTIAGHVGLPLTEYAVDPSDITLDGQSGPLIPQPGPHVVAQHFDSLLREAASQHGADAFINGGGGDNVFGYSNSAAPIADMIRSGCSWHSVAKAIGDIGSMTGSTTLAVLGNLTRRLRDPSPLEWGIDESFISEAGRRSDRLNHPWVGDSPVILPGKGRHIRALARVQSYTEGLQRADKLPLILPLMSQPIVEFCLNIPSWEWIDGGSDRALARKAFRMKLPQAIVTRKEKAGLSAFFSRVYDQKRQEVRSILLDGILAKNRIISPRLIDSVTSRSGPSDGNLHYRLIELTGYEIWARSITKPRRNAF
jgi:asparagine synthase (glutamine-hydrolysing)